MRPRHHDPEARAAFAHAVSAYFASRYQGRYCDVRWYNEEGSTRALVLHGSKASIKNVDAEGEEQSLTFREIVQDTIDYDIGRGTSPSVRRQCLMPGSWPDCLPSTCLETGEFFDRNDAANFYTLEPINDRGVDFASMQTGEDEVADVFIREVQVDEGVRYGKGKKKHSPWAMTVRDNRNALTRIQELAPDVEFGDLTITYVKLEILFDIDGSESRVVGQGEAPDVGQLQGPLHEGLILKLLERNGIRRLRPAFPTAAAAE